MDTVSASADSPKPLQLTLNDCLEMDEALSLVLERVPDPDVRYHIERAWLRLWELRREFANSELPF